MSNILHTKAYYIIGPTLALDVATVQEACIQQSA